MFEAQFDAGLLHLLLQPGLRTHQILHKLRNPPDRRVAMETLEPGGQVLRDGQGQVGGAGVKVIRAKVL